ncbi:MAG: glycoside hydrolase family 88 protein [Bacteroides sp.]|nr:glycoside hydrolase family 88 protein [Bacteroides sp.]
MMKRIILLLCVSVLSAYVCAQIPFTRSEVARDMRRVADWQIAHFKEVPHDELNWVNATFYLGLIKWAEISEQVYNDDFYYQWMLRLGRRNYWQVDKRMYHADDVCISQTYLDLYRKYGRREMIVPTIARTEWVMAHPSEGPFELDYRKPETVERWTWCDAIFMAPPVYARLYTITGDKKFLRFMDREFKATYDYLFDEEEDLFYRDHRYFTQREANGEKVFWGRGNGWVLGGLVEMLRELPKGHRSRDFYENLFIRISKRIAPLQGTDGFWRASLLDPDSYPSPETSCSGFFVYALAYGINEGLLDRDEFLPVVEKGWKALVSAIEEDGKLGWVQPIGADPKKVSQDMTEVYGPGAFLLAGAEVYQLAQEGTKALHYISPERIQQIKAMLPDPCQGIGLSYKNREYWDELAKGQAAIELVNEAERLDKTSMPPFVDSLYLDLLSSGVRLPGEDMVKARFSYVWKLGFAECLENKRRFIPAIEKGIIALCEQKPWSIPAHDRSLQNYNGTDYYVDLVVATEGNSLAQLVYMLDDKLSFEVRARVQCALQEKVFRPIRKCIENDSLFYWFTVTNNWNSVCLAGVTGAATAVLTDKEERAFFIAVAEKSHEYGMKGYGDDGYCSEGVGYYNYGFRAFILLREQICRATAGKIDLFQTSKFARIAQYGRNIQIVENVCPAYSDCRIGLSPESAVVDYCDQALGISDKEETLHFPKLDNLSLNLIECFPNQAWKIARTPEIEQVLNEGNDPLRTYYPLSGVAIARPAEGSECRLGVSFKGGNNAENHNHNDIGSYTVALGKETMLGDQGGPFSYPGDFWARDAYEKYKSKGSYGHPVPVVNGHQQQAGSKAQGKILRKEDTAAKDLFEIDYTSAYPDPELKKLVRTFTYDRTGKGCFIVEDTFDRTSSGDFETAITTRADWEQTDAQNLILTSGKEKVKVHIEASGAVELNPEVIEENAPSYTRVGIRLKKPVTNGYIRLTIEPIHL